MKGYSAFILTEESREKIRSIFEPKYERFIGHHITDEFDIEIPENIETTEEIEIIGYACADGVEALVASVNGKMERKGGGIFHITWSLAVGRKPFESNNLIKKGFKKINPFKIEAKKSFISFALKGAKS